MRLCLAIFLVVLSAVAQLPNSPVAPTNKPFQLLTGQALVPDNPLMLNGTVLPPCMEGKQVIPDKEGYSNQCTNRQYFQLIWTPGITNAGTVTLFILTDYRKIYQIQWAARAGYHWNVMCTWYSGDKDGVVGYIDDMDELSGLGYWRVMSN